MTPKANDIGPVATAGPVRLTAGTERLGRGMRKFGQCLMVTVCLLLAPGTLVLHAEDGATQTSVSVGEDRTIGGTVPEAVRDELAALHAEHRTHARTDVLLPAGPALLDYAAALTDHGAPFAARMIISTIIEDSGIQGSQAEIAAVRMGGLVVLAQAYLADDDPVRATLALGFLDQAGAEALSMLSPSMQTRLDGVRDELAELGAASGKENVWGDEAQSLLTELIGKQVERQDLFARFLAAYAAKDLAEADAVGRAFVELVERDDVLAIVTTLLIARTLTIGTDDGVERDVTAARPWLERVLDIPVAYLAAVPAFAADTKHPVDTLILASAIFRQEEHFDVDFAVRLAERATQVATAVGPEHNLHYTAALEAHAAALDIAGDRKAAEAAWSRLITHYRQLPDEASLPLDERRRYAQALAAFADLVAREPGREMVAETAFVDALRIAEGAGDALMGERASILVTLSGFYSNQSRYDEAMGVQESAIALSQRSGNGEGPEMVYMLARLGSLQVQSGAIGQAAQTLARARSVGALTLSETDPVHAIILDDLVAIYESRGEPVPAPLAEARQAARAARSGRPAPIVVRGRAFLGMIDDAYGAFTREDWQAAIGHARAAYDLAETYGDQNWQIDALRVMASIETQREDHVAALDYHRQTEALLAASPTITLAERQDGILSHMQTAILAAETADAGDGIALYDEAFGLAQKLNRASVGARVEQANLRRSIEKRPVSALLRRLQEGQDARDDLAADLSLRLMTGQSVTQVREAIDIAEARIAELEADVERRFPDYADHLGGSVSTLSEAAAALSENEALIIFATRPVPSGTGVHQLGAALVLTRSGFATNLISYEGDLGALARRLRCAAALTDPLCASSIVAAANQRGAISLEGAGNDENAIGVPAFDYEAAHAAYETLLAPLPLDLALDGVDSLIIIPDSSLVAMPFHLMVTQPTMPGTAFSDAPWLLRGAAVTIAPTVSSFVGLRRERSDTPASVPARRDRFLGIGDPLIGRQADGPLNFDCDTVLDRTLDVASAANLEVSQRGVVNDVMALRDLAALPDTECELNATASMFGAEATLLLHEQANEAAIKQMSADGRLEDYTVVSFATHGLIAGEIGTNNAGLVLTPPEAPGPDDDGLLTSAEIAALDLDADFVLLSACNTAAGDDRDAEGLSGLASAFFFAGTRNLLVSHWPVYSDAATRLTTGLFAALEQDPGTSRAQALRASMLAILDDPAATDRQRHPAYWAPFMLVGEGG